MAGKVHLSFIGECCECYRSGIIVVLMMSDKNRGRINDDASAPDTTYIYHWLILGLRPANERRRYKVTPSPIGLAQT